MKAGKSKEFRPSGGQKPYSKPASRLLSTKIETDRIEENADIIQNPTDYQKSKTNTHSFEPHPNSPAQAYVISSPKLLRSTPVRTPVRVELPIALMERKEACLSSGFPFFFAKVRCEDKSFAFSEGYKAASKLLMSKTLKTSSLKLDVEKHHRRWLEEVSQATFFVTERKGVTKSLGTISAIEKCGIDFAAMTTLVNLTLRVDDLPDSKDDTYLIEAALLHAVLSTAGLDIVSQAATRKVLNRTKTEHIEAVRAELLRMAATWENPNILHEMLRQGYDPNKLSPLSLTNPIYMANLHNNKTSKELLLKYGAADVALAPEEPLEENLRLDLI